MAWFDSSHLPPAINRLRRWYLLVPIPLIAGAVRSYYWWSLPTWAKSPWVSYWPVIAMITVIVVLRVLEVRLRRRARVADDRICPDCLYPLEGDAGICPECGRPFTISNLHDAWRYVS